MCESMRKIYILIIIACASVYASAQEKYSVVLERSKALSPYEAIYELMDYQYWKPELPAVYYELGNLCYSLLPTRDPLHHYTELSTLLYQSRLFYGNCLHFAKEQKLPGWQYSEIANGQKKIEYETLEAYVRPRLKDVERQKIACDSIYHTFCRMSDRYNRCLTLFNTFLGAYTREKTAHLQLQPEEREMLMTLQREADSLETDIRAFKQALALQPISGYNPVFRKEEIALYRLDGLTYTDFLQNNIALWDYSKWVSRFLDTQTEVYERLYADIDREYRQLSDQIARYEAGQTISGTFDGSLSGRCERLEFHSARVDSIRAMQQTIRHAAAEQLIARSEAPQSIRELQPVLQIAASVYGETPDSALTQIKEHLIRMAQPLSIQHAPTYIHPVTGETIRYTAYPGEQVHCLLPDENGYRCVVSDENGTRVLCLNRELTATRVATQAPNEKPLVYTRIPGNRWVLITDQNLYFDAVQ